MQIAQDAVVSIHYTLTNDKGETLDSSAGADPLVYLHGNGNLIPGLERALVGKQAGDKVIVKIAPADAYGEFDQSLIQQVPLRSFKGVGKVQAGMQFQVQANGGPRMVTVTKVVGDMVTVDVTPPAGRGLPRLTATAAFDLSTALSIQYAAGLGTTCNLSGLPVSRGGTNKPGAVVTVVGTIASAGTNAGWCSPGDERSPAPVPTKIMAEGTRPP